jgi:broad specificity phosphatase PhoE
VSSLSLIRHGQAKFFQAEEGVLSPLGEKQAARLAHFWLKHRIRFDEVHTGSLVRHLQTERVVAECFRQAGEPWPAATQDPAWNEYDFSGVFTHLVPGDSRLAALAEEFAQARGGPDENRKFHRVLKAAMTCWLDENCEVEGLEPWPSFRDRLSGAIRRLMAGPSGRRVVVFTSGGPIGFSVHFALQAPPQSFLELNWRVRNGSVTEFIFDRDRFALDSFNAIPHLDDVDLRTFR